MAFLGSIIKPLAYISLPVVLIRSLCTRSPTVRYYTRLGAYLGAMAAVATCSIFIAAGMSILGRKYDANWVVARVFDATAGRLMGIEWEVEGEEHLQTRPAVMMGNHQSMLDILGLGRMFPQRAAMVAKKELRLTPLGPWMTLSGAIWLNRGNSASAVRSLEAAGEEIKREKLSLWIFPEGTRHSSEAPDMLPLKKGGFHLAIQAGVPIIPVVFENYWRLYHRGVFEGGKLKIRILPPIPTTGLTTSDVHGLATRVRDQMLEALREISVKVPAAQAPASMTTKAAGTSVQPRSGGSPQPAVSEKQQSTLGLGDAPDVSVSPSRGSGESLSTDPALDVRSASPTQSRTSEASENGTETEEDEGMVLVGRPA
ncbi:1-acyl-sn-glycerol-3-phosphate acyltransferase [Pleurotus pulmonarius]